MQEKKVCSCKTVFIVTVLVVAALLLGWILGMSANSTHGWRCAHPITVLVPPAATFLNSATSVHVPLTTTTSPAPKEAAPVEVEATGVKLLGKEIERRRIGSADGIYVSVKTTKNNHKSRIAPILLTWLQTVKPDNVHIVTEAVSKDDEVCAAATKLGMNIIETNCTVSHLPVSLCCKSGEEYLQYYRETLNNTKNPKSYKWFCHFDDDMYANIPTLVAALSKTGNKTDDGVYFGRWPGDVVLDRLKKGIKIKEHTLHAVGIHDYDKTKLMVKWATGAAYCISASLMAKMWRYFNGNHTYSEYCKKVGLNDDLVPATLAGYTITHTTEIKSHYDGLGYFSNDRLKQVLTISHHGGNRVNVKGAKFSVEADPTRFLSYHCLLYPSTRWCN